MRKCEALKLAMPLALIAHFGGAVACTAAVNNTQPSRLTSCQPGFFTSLKINEPAPGGVYAANTGACGAIYNPVGEKQVGHVPTAENFILICKESIEAASVVVNYRGILGAVSLSPELAAMDLVGPAGSVPRCQG